MKKLISIMLLGVSSLAIGGELEKADTLLRAKAYDKAFPIYSKLAQAGDTEAQFRLGEMYWYGDGTAVDLAAANTWLRKAAQQGHRGAVESLDILKKRETRTADIAYWTSAYQPKDVVVSSYDCAAPELPVESKTKESIREVANRYKAWQACYDGFAAKMNAQVRSAPQIPADVLELMTPREAEQSFARLHQPYMTTIAAAERDAMRITGRYMAWQNGTERSVQSANIAFNLEYQLRKRRAEEREMIRYPSREQSVMSGSIPPGTVAPMPNR
ncbi:MAG: sel1 repeat family protein [Massilia sp.]|nr:MAG: sel1 repeat family protein [Massilia sp.]